MSIVLTESDGSTLIRLEGVIDISAGAEFKAAISQALATGKVVHLSAEAVTDLDVTAFQLLWIAGRETKRSGVHLESTGEIPEPVRDALSEMGLDLGALFGSQPEQFA